MQHGSEHPQQIGFGDFLLDRQDRSLRRGGEVLDLGSRYFDALVLLVDNPGKLVSKNRFMEEVWRGIPVTDEALTQCVRSLRKALDDDASAPRFIETVPKHGYRFVASVEHGAAGGSVGSEAQVRESDWTRAGRLAGGTTLGGAMAGMLGGILYGAIAGADAQAAGTASASVFLVMLALCMAVGTLGAAGVGTGMAIARALRGTGAAGLVVGGAAGGLIIGALGKLLGLDGFALLVGSTPGNITGMSEGAVVGATTGAVGWWILDEPHSKRSTLGLGALAGALGGSAIALAGGRLMAGSLALLHRQFPETHLHVDAIAREVGHAGTALVATTALEAALFVACAAALIRWLRARIV